LKQARYTIIMLSCTVKKIRIIFLVSGALLARGHDKLVQDQSFELDYGKIDFGICWRLVMCTSTYPFAP
jgi:hypothetical protein